MNAFTIISIINFTLLVMACIYVMTPIRPFREVNGYYSFLLIIILSFFVVVNMLNRGNIIPSESDIADEMYSTDPSEMARRQYIINLLSFVLYQAFTLWLFI